MRGIDIKFDVKHVKAHRTENEKTMTNMQEFAFQDLEKADESGKEGADVD